MSHEVLAEREFGLKLIVRAASQPDPIHRRFAATRVLEHVIEFETAALFAAVAGLALERALAKNQT